MKEILDALSVALGRQITWPEFRELLGAAYVSIDKAVADQTLVTADDPGPVATSTEEQPPTVEGTKAAAAGQALPGGQHLFETPAATPIGLGICPNPGCGSAIVQAATATEPAVCLACGPLT